MDNSKTNQSCTFSLPFYQIQWLDDKEKADPHKKRSRYVQEAIDLLIKQQHHCSYDRVALTLFLLLVGGTLALFTFLLMPVLEVMFIVSLIISFISLTGGYYGIYFIYKNKKNGGKQQRWIS